MENEQGRTRKVRPCFLCFSCGGDHITGVIKSPPFRQPDTNDQRCSMYVCDLIIPVLDEAPSIDPLFDAIDRLRDRGVIRHVIVADGGSTDGSPALAAQRGAVIVPVDRRGYGAAHRAGLTWIERQADPNPDAVAFIGADLSDDASRLEVLIDALHEHDLALGSRHHFAKRGALNIMQQTGGVLSAGLLFLTTGHRYRDIGPMRAIRWQALERLHMRDQTWGWNVEMQAKAAIAKLRIVEIDVPHRPRANGRGKISGSFVSAARAGVRMIFTILRVRLLWWPRRSES